MRVLAISAHPDDETIGAGGALLRHQDDGDELHWCIVTQTYTPQWTEEQMALFRGQTERVAERLGMKSVHRCGFPTVKLNTIATIDLSSAIQRAVDEVRPEVVYIPAAHDVNDDHVAVHHAALVATRPLPWSSVRRVLGYEISTTSRFGIHGFAPNVFIDITNTLERKLELMALYESELRPFPHPRSLEALRLFAVERGISVGLGAAECFELVRDIRR